MQCFQPMQKSKVEESNHTELFKTVDSTCVSRPLPPAGTGDLSGPTDSSNWVIPGRLLTGAYPSDFYGVSDTQTHVKALLNAGVYFNIIVFTVCAELSVLCTCNNNC